MKNLRYACVLLALFHHLCILVSKSHPSTSLTLLLRPRGGRFLILNQSCSDKPKWVHQSIFPPLASHPALFPRHFTGGDKVANFKQAAQIGKLRAIYFVISPQFNRTFLCLVLLRGFLSDGQICPASESLCGRGHSLYIWLLSQNRQLFPFCGKKYRIMASKLRLSARPRCLLFTKKLIDISSLRRRK